MQIYVINLARSADRLAHITAQLGAQGLKFERVEATDGNALGDAALAAFANERPRALGHEWMPGQVGCFLSHLECWQRIAARDDAYALMLEDDVHVSDALVSFVGDDSWILAGSEVVRVETTGQWLKLGRATQALQGRRVAEVLSTAWGSGGYIISRTSAARLAASSPYGQQPVDAFLFNKEDSAVSRNLKVTQVFPALVCQDKFRSDTPLLFRSSIEADESRFMLTIRNLRRQITSRFSGKSWIRFR